jgi:hypothetical protein
MSAAANAAGYLYAHGLLPVSDAQADEPVDVLQWGQSQPLKLVSPPRIEYRKRRFYALPSAA